MAKMKKGKSSSTHGPRTRSVPVRTPMAKSSQGTRTHSPDMRIVQQGPGK